MLRRVEPQEDVACPYGECDGTTWVLDEAGSARPCRCRDQRVRKAASGGVGTGIGRRFLEVSFDREPIVSLDSMVLRQVRAFVRSIEDHLDSGRGLWFDGPVGTGKTSLAILVAKAAKEAGRSYAVYPVPRLLAEIKRTFDRDASDTYLGFFRRLCSVDVLVLDDLGAEKQTEWVLEQLYSIVNERWQDRRSIVVTTNIPDADPEAPARMLQASVRDLRDATTSGRVDGRDLEDLRRLVDRVEQVTTRVAELDVDSGYDPILRLRRQIGARTVSRLVEICDDPIPIMGPDLRMAAQGA
ncbi:MAG: replication protein DnaC [Thermoleophilaceae bacterium]|nr:replication protein DnaC [Thermoleophilaceae bacterium]MEA2401772.1 replication protein DnaC [Thermoleophilaceae bacterium]MEA2456510.1 replication protein DnaC [Thermoleophilaceae bacterium]